MGQDFPEESGGTPRYMAVPDINTEDFIAAVDFLSVRENADPERIGIIGICGWGGMALNAAALDTRIKATAAMTMYDMSRVNVKGYFDAEDSAQARREKRKALCAQRTVDYKSGEYALGGGVADPLPEDAPFFVKDYHQKGVAVIPGSSNPDHIQENTELYHFELTEDEMAQINSLDRGEKHDWY